MNFNSTEIYQLREGEIIASEKLRTVEPITLPVTPSFIKHGFEATGLCEKDFAVFGYVHGITSAKISYLVTSYSAGTGILVNSDLIESSPEQFVTQHLADLFLSAKPNEIEQFGIDSLISYIKQTYAAK